MIVDVFHVKFGAFLRECSFKQNTEKLWLSVLHWFATKGSGFGFELRWIEDLSYFSYVSKSWVQSFSFDYY